MDDLKLCPVCGTVMVKQIVEEPITKEYLNEYLCFKCGCTEPFGEEEGEYTYVQN